MEQRHAATADDAMLWFEEYRQPIFYLCLAFLIAVLIYGAMLLAHSMKESDTAGKLAAATTVDAKLQVATQYLGTDQAALALLFVSSEQGQDKNYDGAIKTYQLFLANYPHHPLSNAARIGLGSSEELKGLVEPALKDYLEAANRRPADSYNALALLDAARLYEKKADLKAARQALVDCSTEYHDTTYGRQAAEKLKELAPAK